MTTNTLPNLQGAYLTGVILAHAKHCDGFLSYRLRLLDVLIQAHEQFPSLNSTDVLAEVRALRDDLASKLEDLEYEAEENRRREEQERFRDLDGDHHEDDYEHLPEHDYPR